MKTYQQFIEEVAANAMGAGGFNVGQAAETGSPYLAGFDMPFGTMKKRKQQRESFAGCPVFTVSNDDYAKCMHGRMRYERWNKKLNMEEIDNQEIRTYAHRNPGKPIIVKDDRYGTMSYFVPPKQEVSESVELDEFTVPGYDQDKTLKANMPKWRKDADKRTREQSKKVKVRKTRPLTNPMKPADESVELGEANYGKPKHMARHKKALQIIKFIDSVEKHKQKWTDSFGDFVKPALNKKLDVNGSGGVEYQQGRGRGGWNFIISSEDTVLYNYRNMPWMPKSGELPFDKFMKLLDTWKKETLRESVEVDEANLLRKIKMDKFSRSERKRKKDNTKKIRKYQKMVGISSEVEYDGESLDERNKTDIPANKQTKDIIQSGKAKILINVLSSIHKNARFVVIQRPLGHRGNLSSNQDKVLMATISDPKKGRIKMFSYHGTHINHQGAMKFAKTNKLVATKDAKGNPLYAKESVELDEYSATRDAASQDAKWMMSVGTKKNKKTPAGKTIQRIQRKLNRGPLSGPSARGRAR